LHLPDPQSWACFLHFPFHYFCSSLLLQYILIKYVPYHTLCKNESRLFPLSFQNRVSLLFASSVDNTYHMEIIIRHNKTIYIRYSDTLSHIQLINMTLYSSEQQKSERIERSEKIVIEWSRDGAFNIDENRERKVTKRCLNVGERNEKVMH